MLLLAHLFFGMGMVSFYTTLPWPLLLAGIVSVLPDIDKPFGHRSWFSHSLLSAVLFSLAAFLAASDRWTYAAIVFLATMTHILLDLLTKSGVPLLYPLLKKDMGMRFFKSEGKSTNKAFMLAGLLILAVNITRTYLAF